MRPVNDVFSFSVLVSALTAFVLSILLLNDVVSVSVSESERFKNCVVSVPLLLDFVVGDGSEELNAYTLLDVVMFGVLVSPPSVTFLLLRV